jgi:hypothetical protein
MRNFTEITRVTSNNCGGKGAWIDNPLNSPRPGNDEWLGFQYGGGGGRKRKTRKTRQVRKRRMSHKTRRKNKKRHHKFR